MELNALYSIIEDLGIIIDNFPMKELVSFSLPNGFMAIDMSKIKTAAEEKVCVAHEGGHYTTGSYYNIHTRLDIKQKHENRANKWAINMLIPQDRLYAAIESGITEYWELAEHFEVTENFMKIAIQYYKDQELANQ